MPARSAGVVPGLHRDVLGGHPGRALAVRRRGRRPGRDRREVGRASAISERSGSWRSGAGAASGSVTQLSLSLSSSMPNLSCHSVSVSTALDCTCTKPATPAALSASICVLRVARDDDRDVRRRDRPPARGRGTRRRSCTGRPGRRARASRRSRRRSRRSRRSSGRSRDRAFRIFRSPRSSSSTRGRAAGLARVALGAQPDRLERRRPGASRRPASRRRGPVPARGGSGSCSCRPGRGAARRPPSPWPRGPPRARRRPSRAETNAAHPPPASICWKSVHASRRQGVGERLDVVGAARRVGHLVEVALLARMCWTFPARCCVEAAGVMVSESQPPSTADSASVVTRSRLMYGS